MLSRRASAFLPGGDFWDGTPLGVTALPFRLGKRTSRFPVFKLCFRTLPLRRPMGEEPNPWLSELISSYDCSIPTDAGKAGFSAACSPPDELLPNVIVLWLVALPELSIVPKDNNTPGVKKKDCHQLP